MKTEWQDYESITYQQPFNINAVEVMLSKDKPLESDIGFVMTTDFQYKEPDDGTKLWVRFWIKEE